jgi:hypothetical protein
MQIITRDGRTREGDTLQDGERIRVGMTFMDSVQKNVAARFKRSITEGHRPGFVGNDSGTDAKTRALDAANREAENAWKTPATVYADAAKAGDVCKIDGRDGHLRERDGGLLCVPDGDGTDDAVRIGDAREQAWRAANLADENAWRRGK